MGLAVGINSWVTVAEADAYLADKFGASAWASLTTQIKEQLLITSFRWIYSNPNFNIPKTSTDELVKNGQIELAWWVYNYIDEYEKRGALIDSGVTEFLLPEWEEKLSKQQFPKFIEDILSDSLTGTGGYFFEVQRDLNE